MEFEFATIQSMDPATATTDKVRRDMVPPYEKGMLPAVVHPRKMLTIWDDFAQKIRNENARIKAVIDIHRVKGSTVVAHVELILKGELGDSDVSTFLVAAAKEGYTAKATKTWEYVPNLKESVSQVSMRSTKLELEWDVVV